MLTAALSLPEGLREKARHTGHLGEAVKAKGLSTCGRGCSTLPEYHFLHPGQSLPPPRVRYHHVTGFQTLYVGRRDVPPPYLSGPEVFSPSNLHLPALLPVG